MKRSKEIVPAFLKVLDQHMADLKSGHATTTFEVQDIAALLHSYPTHLSNTVQEEFRRSPCDVYEERLMQVAKELVLTTALSLAEIATQSTFAPSNFSKFFQHIAGTTPKKFRDASSG